MNAPRTGNAVTRRGRPVNPSPSVTVPILLRLRPADDQDLIQFFASIPPRRRALMLKSALRGGIQTFSSADADTLSELQDLTANLLI
jgi:hypothetical protein